MSRGRKDKKKPKIKYRTILLPSEDVPCPWCGAKPGERCSNPSGETSTIHKARRMYEQVLAGSPGAQARLDTYLELLKKRSK